MSKKTNDAGVPFLGSSRVSTEKYKNNYNSIFNAKCNICGEEDKKSRMHKVDVPMKEDPIYFHEECYDKNN